jgi:hypothetical protein
MKHVASVAVTLPILAGCASGFDPDRPVQSACAGMQCFRESEIRDVELIDDQTLVAFVGPQRCAYRMELDGNYCGYTILGPMIDFQPSRRSQILADEGVEQRICLTDRPYVSDPVTQRLGASEDLSTQRGRGRSAVAGLPAPVTGRLAGSLDRGDQCRVAKITPLNDDELLELYTDKGKQPPLPPVGSGEISVPASTDKTSGDQTGQAGEAAAPPAGTSAPLAATAP